MQPCKTMRRCVLSSSVNQPLTFPSLSSVLFLPGLLFLHRCPCACRCWLGAAFRRAPVNVCLRLSLSSTHMSMSRALPFVHAYVNFCACPFVCAPVILCASAFRLRIRPCLAPCLSSTRTCLSSTRTSMSRAFYLSSTRMYVCCLSSSDVARRRWLMLSVPLIRTAANPQSR
jgi:hypothetical protein